MHDILSLSFLGFKIERHRAFDERLVDLEKKYAEQGKFIQVLNTKLMQHIKGEEPRIAALEEENARQQELNNRLVELLRAQQETK